jgi:hypothetical protein
VPPAEKPWLGASLGSRISHADPAVVPARGRHRRLGLRVRRVRYLTTPMIEVREIGEFAHVELDRPDPYRRASFAPTTKVGFKRFGGKWLIMQTAATSNQ